MLGHFKYGYAPRGFLIDYDNFNLVCDFTRQLRQYLFPLGFVYIRIDPNVIHIERDKRGNEIHSGKNNDELMELLKNLGYVHNGFNLYFEALKPRWNAITKLNTNTNELFKAFEKNTRNKIRKGYKRGIIIYKGKKEDIKLLYSLIDKKNTNRKINYYHDYYEIFSKYDMFDIYFAKLDPNVYIKTSKDLYENELRLNNELANLVQKNTKAKLRNRFINIKMDSDRRLEVYKKDVVTANNISRTYPQGIIIAASAVIKYSNEIFFLIDGYISQFKSFSANYIMKWAIMSEYARKGYNYAHHNGITGDFSKDNAYYGLYQFKRGFNSEIVENIGEFDMIINKNLYNTQKQIKSIKNLFNLK
jgi:lipid II:glycine glycyltransferase (peptidoglycan interpeptide bridge formation enzyme)